MTTTAATAPNHLRWPMYTPRLSPYALVAALGLILWTFIVRPMLLTLHRSIEGSADVWSVYGSFFILGSGVAADSVLGSIGLSCASAIAAGVTGTALAVFLPVGFSIPKTVLCSS